MGKRITATFTIDEDLWILADVLLPCSRSAFIEKKIKEYIEASNEIEELQNEIKEFESELETKKEKLEQLLEIREKNNKNKLVIKSAMRTVRDIVSEHGVISEKQIVGIANSNEINSKVLRREVKKNKIKISKFTQDYVNKSDRNLRLE